MNQPCSPNTPEEIIEKGSMLSDFEHLNARKTKIFINIVYAVWLITFIYVIVYFKLSAWLGLTAVTLGTLIFSPLTVLLEKKGHSNTARAFFILCCNFYIYSCSLSLRHQTCSEYYYLPATMLPLLVFELSQATAILLGITTPLALWSITKIFGFGFIPDNWTSTSPLSEIIANINFLGAFFTTLVFLHIFMKAIFSLRDMVVTKEIDKIEKLKKINATLREQSYFLHEAQRIAKIGNWVYDFKSEKITCSDEMYNIFSRKRNDEEPTFAEYRANIHPSDLQKWEQTLIQCRTDGKPYEIRFRMITPDANRVGIGDHDSDTQKYKWVETRGQGSFGNDSKVNGIFGTCQDITEEVRLQKLVAQEKIRAIHDEKLIILGELSAGIAHEVNNPLAIIDGNIRLLTKTLDDPEKTKARIDTIEKSVARITKIISGLRKFSRRSDEGEKAERKISQISPIINEVITFVQMKSERHRVQISLETTSTATFLCNDVEIEQVLINIINNGIDAIKNNNEKWIKIKTFDDKINIIIQIIDSGNGIPKEIKDKLFNPFFTTKQVGEGTGLGLSISKGIISSCGGTLELLENSSNTCFEIRFPITPQNPDKEPSHEP